MVYALCEQEMESGLLWYKSQNPSIGLQSIQLLALRPEVEWKWCL